LRTPQPGGCYRWTAYSSVSDAQAATVTPSHTGVPSPRRLRTAIAWTLGGDSASKVAVLILNLLAARQLVPTEFGLYVGILATSLLGSAFWDAGVSTLVSVEVAKKSTPAAQVVRRALALRLPTLPVWGIVLALGYAILARSQPVDAAVLIAFSLASLMASIQIPVLAALRARLGFRDATLASAAGRWTTTGLVAVAFLTSGAHQPLLILALATAAGEAVTTGLGFALLRPWVAIARAEEWDPSGITLRRALPYASNSVLGVAYNRLDVVLVAALTSASQFAAYAPASRIQDALYLLPGSLSAVAVPVLSRYATGHDAARNMSALMQKLWIAGVALALPASLVLFVLMPQAISFLLGPGYADSAAPTRILMWSMLVSVVGAPLLAVLIAVDRGVDTSRAFAAAFVVSIVLHFSLDWWLGALGAAIASLSRDGANAIVAAWYTRRALQRLRASGPDLPLVRLPGLRARPDGRESSHETNE
jgi:O-antigen/teichoic acid export membrane protein